MIRIIAQNEDLLPDEPGKPKTLPSVTPEPIPTAAPAPSPDIPEGLPTTEGIPLADEEPLPPGETTWQPHPDFPSEEFEEITPLSPKPPTPDKEPKPTEVPTPEKEFEEVKEELTKLDDMNRLYSIDKKIEASLAWGYPLRILYTDKRGHTTERTIRPEYYFPAKTTGNLVLIAWCELRNDWRGFLVNPMRIRGAKLEPIYD